MDPNIHLSRDRAMAFDNIAGAYSRGRPGYPTELGATILRLADPPLGGRFVEIGVGAGQATRLFLGKGFQITGIEPGLNLQQEALRNLESPADLNLVHATFEEWDAPKNAYDLVYAGSAFHWVDPQVGFPKIARILKPNGSLAIFWNMFPDPTGPIWDDIQAAYRHHLPHLAEYRFGKTFAGNVEARYQQLADAGLFRNLSIYQFPWSLVYAGKDYLNLLLTYSDHALAPESERQAMFNDIESIIDRHGGTIVRPWVTVLYHATA